MHVHRGIRPIEVRETNHLLKNWAPCIGGEVFPRNPQALLGAIIIQDVISSPTSRIPHGQHGPFEEIMPPPSCLVPNWRPGATRSPLQATFYARVNKGIRNQNPIRTGPHVPSFNRKHTPRLSQPMLQGHRGSLHPTLTHREDRPQTFLYCFLSKYRCLPNNKKRGLE